MNALVNSRYFLRDRFMLLLGACLMIYFSFHAIVGQRSLVTLYSGEVALVEARAQLNELRAAREVAGRKVVLLRPDTLDLDYVEELAFSQLGYRQAAQVTVVEFSPDAAQQ